MAEISHSKVYDGVTRALHRAFPHSKIHGGKTISQGLGAGVFNVLPISANHAKKLGKRNSKSVMFDVIYYTDGARDDGLAVAEKLPQVLELIITDQGDKLHCNAINCELVDNVLHCIVSYPYFTYKPTEETPMETIKTVQEV